MLEKELTSSDRCLLAGYLTRIALMKFHLTSLFINKRNFSVMSYTHMCICYMYMTSVMSYTQ